MAENPKQRFLDSYDREHATTRRVLRAYPPDKLDLKPSDKSASARGLAWTFVVERQLGMMVWNDAFAKGVPAGEPPQPPDNWEELLSALEKAHRDFRAVIAETSESALEQQVSFFTAPKTMGRVTRLDFAWFLLHDEIHHRGQFSVYLRLAGAKVPSIYGPTADEPWM